MLNEAVNNTEAKLDPHARLCGVSGFDGGSVTWGLDNCRYCHSFDLKHFHIEFFV